MWDGRKMEEARVEGGGGRGGGGELRPDIPGILRITFRRAIKR